MTTYTCDNCEKDFTLMEDLEEAYCPYCGIWAEYYEVEK